MSLRGFGPAEVEHLDDEPLSCRHKNRPYREGGGLNAEERYDHTRHHEMSHAWFPTVRVERSFGPARFYRRQANSEDGHRPAHHPPAGYRHIVERVRRDPSWKVEEKSILNSFKRDWDRIRTGAGLEVSTFHALRKSFISNWLERGVPIQEAQILAGHRDITTTRKYYVRVRLESAKRRARKAAAQDAPRPRQTISGRPTQYRTGEESIDDRQVTGVQSLADEAPVAQQDRASVS